MTQVLDNGARIQYTTQASQTIFTYPFMIFEDIDLNIYLRGPSDPVNPPGELLTLNVDYTVQGDGNESGGTITLLAIPTTNSILTIERDVPFTQLVDFTVGGKFTGETLNFVMDKLTLLIQQVEMLIEDRGLLYDATESLTVGQTTLPKLPPNTGAGIPVWTANGSGNLVAGICDETTTCSTLRSELLSQTQVAPGTDNVGYYDPFVGGVTLTDELSILRDLHDRSNLIIGGDFSTNPWQRETTFNLIGIVNEYTADRWQFEANNAGYTVVVSKNSITIPPNTDYYSSNSYKVFNTLAHVPGPGDLMVIKQKIEGYTSSVIHTNGFTMSFWVNSTKTGVFSVAFFNVTGSERYIAEVSVSAAATWEFVTLNVPAPPSTVGWDFGSVIGMEVMFVLAAGSGHTIPPSSANQWLTGSTALASSSNFNFADTVANEFLIERVSIIPGQNNVFYPFETFSQVLQKCKRFYQKSYSQGVVPGSLTAAGANIFGITNNVTVIYTNLMIGKFLVEMRTSPILSWYNPTTGAKDSIDVVDVLSLAFISSHATSAPVDVSALSTGYALLTPSITMSAVDIGRGQWVAEAEL